MHGSLIESHRGIVGHSPEVDEVRDLGWLNRGVVVADKCGGLEMCRTLAKWAAAFCFTLAMNHPFAEGNKPNGHAAMSAFLVMNGFEITAGFDDVESIILCVAACERERCPFVE